jgi:hypothetical protein
MEKRMYDMAKLFVGNGFGFGKYWAGYVFAKSPKDPCLFYISEQKMAILSASPDDEDGEREIILAADDFSPEELAPYFKLNHGKYSKINWLQQPVNVILLCEQQITVRNNMLYYMWPAVQLNFVSEPAENTLIIYDRFASKERLERLKAQSVAQDTAGETEYWSMVKLLAMGDRFGELAPKVCMSSVPGIRQA